ncbi:MAG TPA: hypothetical protein VE053_06550 [Allosphingosinicella sp.]|nr:hypothetical protein [Allosphingosinicella sp.]
MTAAFDAMLRWICRAAVGLTLTLAAAAPSFAEVGCFEDVLKHGLEAANAADGVARAPAEDGDERRSDRPSHCAFGHCPQWVPAALPERAGASDGFSGQIYSPFLVHRHAQSPRDGPERPPRT